MLWAGNSEWADCCSGAGEHLRDRIDLAKTEWLTSLEKRVVLTKTKSCHAVCMTAKDDRKENNCMHMQIASSLYCYWAYRIHDQADTSVVFSNCSIIPKTYWKQEKSGVAFTLYVKTVQKMSPFLPNHLFRFPWSLCNTWPKQELRGKAYSCPNKT